MTEIWDVWYPKAGATGISFARGRIDGAAMLLVHAAPPVLTVTVRSDAGRVLAAGKDLTQTAATPMTRLTRVTTASSVRTSGLVLLAGGEVGTLLQWWHAADHSQWRWQIELYNHR